MTTPVEFFAQLERHRWLQCVLLLCVTLLVYANSFPAAFIQDDLHIVVNNPLVRDLDLLGIFTSDYWVGVEQSGLYRPLTILSLALNRLLLGEAPWGFHLVNLLLHTGCVLLLWRVLLAWCGKGYSALVSALLFALHPLHAEVVNVVVGRSELLVALLLLTALLVARRDGWRENLGVVICFGLALLAKEHAVIMLALLPLLEWFESGSMYIWRRRWRLYGTLLIVTVLWLLIRDLAVAGVGVRSVYSVAAVPLAHLPWDSRVATALLYQWVYLFKLLIPLKLQAVYSQADLPSIIPSIISLQGVVILCSWTGVTILIWRGWKRRRWWSLFALLYVISFVPTSNVFLAIGVTFAERLAYLPSLWFCSGIVVLADELLSQRGIVLQRLAWMVCVAGLLLYAGLLVQRNRDFSSELLLWSQEVRGNPGDYLGWQSYADVLNSSHRYAEAEQAYRRLLDLQPEFQGGLRSYIAFLREQRRFAEAVPLARKCLDLSERLGDAAGTAYDLTNLAHLLIELGQNEEALAVLQRTGDEQIQERDYYPVLLGRALAGVGNHAAAVEAYGRLRSYRMDQNVPLYWGLSLLKLGRLEEARKQLELATRSNPLPESWNLLGTVYAQQGRLYEARQAFQRAVEMAPDNRYYRENLERILQMSADREEAVN